VVLQVLSSLYHCGRLIRKAFLAVGNGVISGQSRGSRAAQPSGRNEGSASRPANGTAAPSVPYP